MKNKRWLTFRTIQYMTSKHKNLTIFPIILRDIDDEKTRFQPAKTQKMTNFSGRLNSNFWVHLRRTSDRWHPETDKTCLGNKEISTFYLLSSEKSMVRKRVISQRNAEKDQLPRTLEFKILRLFMENKCWLTSRITQIMTSKHKKFTIFPLILRDVDAEKTRIQPAKTQNMKNYSGLRNSKFWSYLWRISDGSHP
jgi:hypothetical protein